MIRYIAILRGINVGGKRKILMDDLKKGLKTLGLANVKTYIQSGNVIFDTQMSADQNWEEAIGSFLLKTYGFEVPVIVRTLAKMKELPVQNPFLDQTVDPGHLHLTFLSQKPQEGNILRIKSYQHPPDQFEIIEDHVFIKIMGNYHESKLSNAFFEKKLDLQATTRNWRTVLKIIELAETD